MDKAEGTPSFRLEMTSAPSFPSLPSWGLTQPLGNIFSFFLVKLGQLFPPGLVSKVETMVLPYRLRFVAGGWTSSLPCPWQPVSLTCHTHTTCPPGHSQTYSGLASSAAVECSRQWRECEMSFRGQLMQLSWRDGWIEASKGRRPTQGHMDIQQNPDYLRDQSNLGFNRVFG